MRFIGRKDELKMFEEAYSNDNYEGILIYGRRRIGKSELIKQSLKNSNIKSIYYECLEASEALNSNVLSLIIGKELNIAMPMYNTFYDVLDFIFKVSINEKIILVIDEYPAVRGKSSFLDSVLQNIIDKYKMNCKMKFVLCGSSIDIMQELTTSSNPLYGRFTYKRNIKQMDYYESSLFYPNMTNEDKVKIYSVFGGIPYYNQFVDDKKSVKDNIIYLIANPNARLFAEAESFLYREMSKLSNANEVFHSIAMGYKKFSDINSQSHVSSSPTLSDVLNKLIELDVIQKTYPINDEKEKKSQYEITERLSNFYYTYIFKNMSYFKVLSSEHFYNEFIDVDFESKYVPKEFERISKEYLRIRNKKGLIEPPLYNIGKYYYDDPVNKRNGEFDVVTFNKNGYDFYEVKFSKDPIDDRVVKEEKEQLSNLNIKYNKMGFVSKSGFNISDEENYILININDLYKDI